MGLGEGTRHAGAVGNGTINFSREVNRSESGSDRNDERSLGTMAVPSRKLVGREEWHDDEQQLQLISRFFSKIKHNRRPEKSETNECGRTLIRGAEGALAALAKSKVGQAMTKLCLQTHSALTEFLIFPIPLPG